MTRGRRCHVGRDGECGQRAVLPACELTRRRNHSSPCTRMNDCCSADTSTPTQQQIARHHTHCAVETRENTCRKLFMASGVFLSDLTFPDLTGFLVAIHAHAIPARYKLIRFRRGAREEDSNSSIASTRKMRVFVPFGGFTAGTSRLGHFKALQTSHERANAI
jgi:hypothetical protein